jgi:hypothetical protein
LTISKVVLHSLCETTFGLGRQFRHPKFLYRYRKKIEKVVDRWKSRDILRPMKQPTTTVVINDTPHNKRTVVTGVPTNHVNTVTKLVEIQNDLDGGKTPRVEDMSFEDRGELLRQMGNLFGGREDS